jgi:co-chaperonin GroES (HSP10)
MGDRFWEPLRDYILVELWKPPTTTAGGIVTSATEKPPVDPIGTVLALGPDVQASFNVGDMVMYKSYAGYAADPENELGLEFFVREADVIAVDRASER